MMRWLPLLLVPLLAQAASGGAWQASGSGATLSLRGQIVASAPLQAAEPVHGVMTQVYWRYQLTGATPKDLQVSLCSATRCVGLDRQNGSTTGFSGVPASESLRFVWQITGQGRVFPAMQVLSNQVVVNYQQ